MDTPVASNEKAPSHRSGDQRQRGQSGGDQEQLTISLSQSDQRLAAADGVHEDRNPENATHDAGDGRLQDAHGMMATALRLRSVCRDR